jgi:hypothetical protein
MNEEHGSTVLPPAEELLGLKTLPPLAELHDLPTVSLKVQAARAPGQSEVSTHVRVKGQEDCLTCDEGKACQRGDNRPRISKDAKSRDGQGPKFFDGYAR